MKKHSAGNNGGLVFLLSLFLTGTVAFHHHAPRTGAPPSTIPHHQSRRMTSSSSTSSSSTTSLHLFSNRNTTPDMDSLLLKRSYGEDSRKYRRTIYTHKDWRKHRSSKRLLRNLSTMITSGVYKTIMGYVAATTAVATFVCLWNALMVSGYTDWRGIKHVALCSARLPKLALPLAPFTLSSPSLGLLLVFKTNTGYSRWDEARKNWGMNINHTRDLCRMGNALYDGTSVSSRRRQQDLNTLALCTWAFVRTMKRHLSPDDEDEVDFQIEMREKLPAKQANGIINAKHRPNRALQDLSTAIENLPMHFLRKDKLHSSVTKFEDNLGSSERLLSSPVPLFYTRHTARFLSIWLLLLPLALYDVFSNSWNHWAMIPASAIISMFLFGIEELSTQMEEPFTILPMQAFCDKIYNWCHEIVSWKAGDTGMQVHEVKPEHSTMSGNV